MIIKLNGADFSKRNIGTVTIPFSPIAETELILSRFSNTQTNTAKVALDKFLRIIKNNGIYENLTSLVLPFLAATKDEALMNVLTGNSAFDGELSSLYFDDKKISVLEGGNIAYLIADGLTYNDFGISVYIPNHEYQGSINETIIGKDGSAFYHLSYSPLNKAYIVQGGIGNSSTGYITTYNGLVTYNIKGTTTIMSCDNTTRVQAVSGNDSQTSRFPFGVYNSDTYTDATFGYSREKISYIAIGRALTESQVQTLNEAIKELMNEIL